MAGQGRTVLVSSHEVSEVARVADRGIILYNSRPLWTGDLESLCRDTCEVLLPSERTPDQVGIAPGAIIHQAPRNGRVRVVVRYSVDEARRKLADHPDTVVNGLGLEEIFVAHLHGAGYRSGGLSLHEAALSGEQR